MMMTTDKWSLSVLFNMSVFVYVFVAFFALFLLFIPLAAMKNDDYQATSHGKKNCLAKNQLK